MWSAVTISECAAIDGTAKEHPITRDSRSCSQRRGRVLHPLRALGTTLTVRLLALSARNVRISSNREAIRTVLEDEGGWHGPKPKA